MSPNPLTKKERESARVATGSWPKFNGHEDPYNNDTHVIRRRSSDQIRKVGERR